MTEREAFIEAIAANPDDTVRLAFADWLQENGEEDRAEFVRMLHELRAGWCEAKCPKQLPQSLQSLRNRVQELFESRGAIWLASFYRALGSEPPTLRQERWSSRLWRRVTGNRSHQMGEKFSHLLFGCIRIEGRSDEPVESLYLFNGFVSCLRVSLESRLPIRDITAAFRLEPVNDLRVTIAGNLDQWQRLNAPCLARLRSLTIGVPNEHNQQILEILENVFHGHHWSGLNELTLERSAPNFQPGPREYIEQLAHSPLLSNLHSLSLMVEQPDLHLLTHQPQIENLRTFSVWGRLMPGATGVIASAAFRPNLEELDLTQSYLEGDWTRALAIVAWPKLRSLDLGGNELTDTGVRSLLPLIPRLTDLSLCGSNITDAGALALADAIDPEKMERFSLSYNPLSPETVDALRIRFGERFHFTASTESP